MADKLTDNDIKKALECCVDIRNGCRKCPQYHLHSAACVGNVMNSALDLINRQQAEIERYKGVIKLLENDVQTAKSEAIKELERKIKAHAYYIDTPKEHRVVDEDDINAVLKEMTEQSTGYRSSKTEMPGKQRLTTL